MQETSLFQIKSLEHVQVNLEEETKASLRLHRETDNAVHDLQAVATKQLINLTFNRL